MNYLSRPCLTADAPNAVRIQVLPTPEGATTTPNSPGPNPPSIKSFIHFQSVTYGISPFSSVERSAKSIRVIHVLNHAFNTNFHCFINQFLDSIIVDPDLSKSTD
jgi:hypothetical protein